MTDSKKAKFDKFIAKAKAEMKEPLALKLVDLLELIGNDIHKEESEKETYKPIQSFEEIPESIRDDVVSSAVIYYLITELDTDGYRLSLDKFNEFMANNKKVSLVIRDEKADFEIVDLDTPCKNCGEVHE